MKALVTGGTGTVGSQVVRELLARGVDVQVLTRDSSKAQRLPEGAEGVVGDLREVRTARTVFQGVDAVFLLNPVGPTETHEGLMGVNGAQDAGVRRLVYLSVHHADKAPYLPHFGSKLAVEAAVEGSGIPYTILRPNNFYQNDFWFRDPLLQFNVYAQPIGDVGLSRVDVRDIAELAAIALTESGHEGKNYAVVGPELWTGTRTAEVWSAALGRPIAYAGNDLDQWEQAALRVMPELMVYDYKKMYAFFQAEGLKATPRDIEVQTKILGHPLRRYEDFVRETAPQWRGDAAAVSG